MKSIALEQVVELAIATPGARSKKSAKRTRTWGGVIQDWPAPNQLRVDFGRWKPYPEDEQRRGELKVLARPGDVVLVNVVGRRLPPGEQSVTYYVVKRDTKTRAISLEKLTTNSNARSLFLASKESADVTKQCDPYNNPGRHLKVV